MQSTFEKSPIVYKERLSGQYIEVEAVMEDIYEPVEVLLERLRPDLERGRYPVILGIDGSGRIPAILVAKTIKKVYASLGHPQPQVRFIAGNRIDRGEAERYKNLLDTYIHNNMAPLLKEGQKVLIVDDTLHQGGTFKFLAEAFKKQNIEVELSALGFVSEFSRENSDRINELIGQEVRVGSGSTISSVYKKQTMAGVEKYSGELHARQLESEPKNEHTYTDMQVRGRTREITNQYAEKLASEFLAKYNETREINN